MNKVNSCLEIRNKYKLFKESLENIKYLLDTAKIPGDFNEVIKIKWMFKREVSIFRENVKLIKAFKCSLNQIARSEDEINENTKYYIGKAEEVPKLKNFPNIIQFISQIKEEY